MAARGADPYDIPHGWTASNHFVALGHRLSDDGSIKLCLNETVKAMWRQFFKIIKLAAKNAETESLVKAINTFVLPIAEYRMSRWPFQRAAATTLDKLQTHMYAACFPVEPLP
eukprot:10610988-Alexandrium_andersonii.AAC.1